MEKLPGRPIGDSWFELSEEERLRVLLQITGLEAKLFAVALPASGSIYYAKDLPPSTPRVHIDGANSEFCIGPYAALRWWFGERSELDIDRGPHENVHRVLKAPAEKELAWLRAYGRPRFPFERAYRETFDYEKQSPEKHADSLDKYLRLEPHLVPTASQLNLPVLRHPDLQPNNIFVSTDFNITGLIDWQHSVVLPTFLAAGMPNSMQNYNDEQSLSFVPPQLPGDLETMDEDDRASELELYRRRHVHFFYLAFTQRKNEAHWKALEQETGILKRRIYHDAGSPWEGLNTSLELDIVRVCQNWSKIAAPEPDGTTPACLVDISEEESKRISAEDEFLRDVDAEMERINRLLGVASDGWTTNESFEVAKERALLIREEGLEAVSDDPWLQKMTDRHWPFDDCDENG